MDIIIVRRYLNERFKWIWLKFGISTPSRPRRLKSSFYQHVSDHISRTSKKQNQKSGYPLSIHVHECEYWRARGRNKPFHEILNDPLRASSASCVVLYVHGTTWFCRNKQQILVILLVYMVLKISGARLCNLWQ